MDVNGLADPYLKVRLFPEDSGQTGNGPGFKWKGRIIKATLNPEWDETV